MKDILYRTWVVFKYPVIIMAICVGAYYGYKLLQLHSHVMSPYLIIMILTIGVVLLGILLFRIARYIFTGRF